METFNSELLRLVRLSTGKSQTQIAKEGHFQQGFLSKVESVLMIPNDKQLQNISSFFQYPVEYFYKDTTESCNGLIFHRKPSALSAVVRDKLEAEAKLRAIDIQELSKYCEPFCSDIIERNGMSPVEIARALRKHWQISSEIPIANLTELLEEHHIIVLEFDFETSTIDGFFFQHTPSMLCIAMNTASELGADRRRFSLAHELGHALLHQHSFPNKTTEDEANEFAAEFLMPKEAIKDELKLTLSVDYLMRLKEKWGVSMAALTFRARTLKCISEGQYKSLAIYMSSLGYRKHESPCNVKPGTASKIGQMIAVAKSLFESIPTILNIPEDIFKKRYPQIELGGNISCDITS